MTIYGHLDSTNTAAASTPGSNATAASDWGRLVSGSTTPGSVARYVKDLGNGNLVVTFVINA